MPNRSRLSLGTQTPWVAFNTACIREKPSKTAASWHEACLFQNKSLWIQYFQLMFSEDQILQASPPPEEFLDFNKGFACRLGYFERKLSHVTGHLKQVIKVLLLPFSYSSCSADSPCILLTGGGRREKWCNVNAPLKNTALEDFRST